MKEDKYEFPLKEWEYTTEPEPFELPAPTKLILTRKKPKVKVEYCLHEGYKSTQYGQYHIVQFRVTGWDGDCASVEYFDKGCLRSLLKNTDTTFHNIFDGEGLYIGRDAIGKWSHPVLLPESTYSRLDEITKALEDRANEVKG